MKVRELRVGQRFRVNGREYKLVRKGLNCLVEAEGRTRVKWKYDEENPGRMVKGGDVEQSFREPISCGTEIDGEEVSETENN